METDNEEEDDMAEQAPIPPSQGVYKRGWVTDQSDNEVIPAPLVP
jgi:hypothetical protein